MKPISVTRPKCDCGGFAILDGMCAECSDLFKSGLYMPCRQRRELPAPLGATARAALALADRVKGVPEVTKYAERRKQGAAWLDPSKGYGGNR